MERPDLYPLYPASNQHFVKRFHGPMPVRPSMEFPSLPVRDFLQINYHATVDAQVIGVDAQVIGVDNVI